MLPASQAPQVLSLSLKPFLLKGILDWCNGMKLTPILMVAPHPRRLLPARIASFPDFLAFNMSPRSIGDLIITPEAIQFVTRLAGSEVIERVMLPIGCWHSVRIRETEHRFALNFPETLLTSNPGDAEAEQSKEQQKMPDWWPSGVALMIDPDTGDREGRNHVPPNAPFGALVSMEPPAWEGLVSATQADSMKHNQDKVLRELYGRIQDPTEQSKERRSAAMDGMARGEALNVARMRWGGATVVKADVHLPGEQTELDNPFSDTPTSSP